MTTITDTVTLLAENSDWIRRLARSLVHDPHAAEDIAQEAAVAALRAEEHPQQLNRSWLAGVVHNIAANRRRRQVRQTRRDQATPPVGPEPATADTVALVEQQRRLSDAVLALDEPFRDVILLRFYEDAPPREIARRLQIPVATVRSRLGRALQKLRGHLDVQHDGDRSVWMSALAPLAAAPLRAGAFGLSMARAKMWGGIAAALFVGAVAVLLMQKPSAPAAPSATDSPAVTVAASDQRAPGVTEIADADRGLARAEVWTPTEVAQPPCLRFIDAATREPVSNVEVYVVDRIVHGVDAFLIDGLHKPLERYPQLGTRHALDADGRLSASALPRVGQAFARSDSKTGIAWLYDALGEDEVREIELWPIETVEVTVRDSRGQPLAGVPIAVQTSMGAQNFALMLEATDARGRAQLRWYEGMRRLGTEGPRLPLRAALAVPGAEHVGQSLDHGRPQIDLVCPPVGRVHVHVTQRGVDSHDGTIVLLGGKTDLLSPTSHPAAFTKDGTASFWPVAIGARLSAGAGLDPDGPWFSVDGPGIERENDSTTMELAIDADLVVVTGRIVDAQGRPRSEQSFTLDASRANVASDKQPSMVNVLTDPSGRFEARLTLAEPDGAEVEICSSATRTEHSSITIAWRSDAPGPFDCGDVRIAHDTPLATGTLVDDRGQPIKRASVSFACSEPAFDPPWRAVDVQPVATDSNGKFKIYGIIDDAAGDYWIRATLHDRPALSVPPQRWKRGASPLRLVAQRVLSMTGQVRAEPGTPLDGIRVIARNERLGPRAVANKMTARSDVAVAHPTSVPSRGRTRASESATASSSCQVDGTFSIGPLEPGLYSLHLLTPADEELLVVPGVVVGANTTDKRLANLDLRDRLAHARLRVKNDAGTSVRAMAYGMRTDGTATPLGFCNQPLLYRKGSLQTMVVVARNHFNADLGVVEGDRDVTLSRGLPVDIRVTGTANAPVPYALRVALTPIDAPAPYGTGDAASRLVRRDRQPNHATVKRGGRATVRVRDAGVYRLHVYVEEMRGEREREHVDLGSAPTVDVRAGASAPKLVIDCAPIAVQRAIDAIAARRRR